MFGNPSDPQRKPPQEKQGSAAQTPNTAAAKALERTALKTEEALQKKPAPQERVSEKITAQLKAVEESLSRLERTWGFEAGNQLKPELEKLIALLADEIGWKLSKENPVEFEKLLQPLPEDQRKLARTAFEEYHRWARYMYSPCGGA